MGMIIDKLLIYLNVKVETEAQKPKAPIWILQRAYCQKNFVHHPCRQIIISRKTLIATIAVKS